MATKDRIEVQAHDHDTVEEFLEMPWGLWDHDTLTWLGLFESREIAEVNAQRLNGHITYRQSHDQVMALMDQEAGDE